MHGVKDEENRKKATGILFFFYSTYVLSCESHLFVLFILQYPHLLVSSETTDKLALIS